MFLGLVLCLVGANTLCEPYWAAFQYFVTPPHCYVCARLTTFPWFDDHPVWNCCVVALGHAEIALGLWCLGAF